MRLTWVEDRLDLMTSSKLCLVTGASGYIGGRLVPELLAAATRCGS
jgi:nucleoside-diphosphate-sugar epimerase